MNAVEQWTRTRYERPIAVRRTVAAIYHVQRRDLGVVQLPPTEKLLGKELQWRIQCRICGGWGKGHTTQVDALTEAQAHLKFHGGAPYRQLRSERDQLRRWALDLESDVEDYRQAAERRNERVNELRHTLTDLLGRFTEKGHPGVASVRTGWVRATYIQVLSDRLQRGDL